MQVKAVAHKYIAAGLFKVNIKVIGALLGRLLLTGYPPLSLLASFPTQQCLWVVLVQGPYR